MLDALIGRLNQYGAMWQANGSARNKVVAIIVVAITVMVSARFVPIETVQIFMGSLAGFVLFIGLYLFWATVLPEDRKKQLNLRGTRTLPQRRTLFLWLAIGWAIIILFVGKYVGGPVVGGLTVAIIMCLWRMATATVAEVEEINEEAAYYDQIRAEQEAEESTQTTIDEYQPKPKRRLFRR